jgi:SHS2 domain-containing protein
MSAPQYEELEHTADWALRVQGKDLKQLFLHAAQGMLSLEDAVAGPGTREQMQIECTAEDRVSLLVSWLEELLFHMELRSITYVDLSIEKIDETQLSAEVTVAPLEDPIKHIKAVTYHELDIVKIAQGLEATIVFDV